MSVAIHVVLDDVVMRLMALRCHELPVVVDVVDLVACYVLHVVDVVDSFVFELC